MLNFALNGFKGTEADPRDLIARKGDVPGLSPFRFVRDDALRFLSEAKRAALSWDIIILDPPVFSNSKRMRGSLDLKRDCRALAESCLALLAPGGRLFISINARSFNFDGAAFPGAVHTDLTEKLRDEDFAGKRIPACCMLEKGK
jgi:23S rRNA G2069 N7-methylase RlmK/C1962 C5-methylase RlmI